MAKESPKKRSASRSRSPKTQNDAGESKSSKWVSRPGWSQVPVAKPEGYQGGWTGQRAQGENVMNGPAGQVLFGLSTGVQMADSRKFDFEFYCGDICFIDFERVGEDGMSVRLLRISFDGYGCCNYNAKGDVIMPANDSADVLEMVYGPDPLDQDALRSILQRYFSLCNAGGEKIWADALQTFGLVA